MTIIVVVDDEAVVRLDVIDVLEGVGFKTIEASSGDEALRILEQHPDICGLFTDIQMPGSLDGMQLAEVVREKWPDKLIIVGSGNVRPTALPARAVFLPKPYDYEYLTEVLENLQRSQKGERDV